MWVFRQEHFFCKREVDFYTKKEVFTQKKVGFRQDIHFFCTRKADFYSKKRGFSQEREIFTQENSGFLHKKSRFSRWCLPKAPAQPTGRGEVWNSGIPALFPTDSGGITQVGHTAPLASSSTTSVKKSLLKPGFLPSKIHFLHPQRNKTQKVWEPQAWLKSRGEIKRRFLWMLNSSSPRYRFRVALLITQSTKCAAQQEHLKTPLNYLKNTLKIPQNT